jgi:hypothetical protein
MRPRLLSQAVLRAWDDGIRRQAVELLLPQADPNADGGWPGGIRQQFRQVLPQALARCWSAWAWRGTADRWRCPAGDSTRLRRLPAGWPSRWLRRCCCA